jgi:hypothetical protein
LSSFAKGGGPALVVAVVCSFVLSFRSEAEESAVAVSSAFYFRERPSLPADSLQRKKSLKMPCLPLRISYATDTPPITYNYFFPKQPKNRLSSPKTTYPQQNKPHSKWHSSYAQPDILKLERNPETPNQERP